MQKLTNQMGHEVFASSDQTYLQGTFNDAFQTRNIILQLNYTRKNVSTGIIKSLARMGEENLLTDLFKYFYPQLFLQTLNLAGNGRLRKIEFVGCTRKTVITCNSFK